MDKIALLNHIRLNGIEGVDGIIDMIIDTIDDGDKEGAKDWLRQLKDEIYEASLYWDLSQKNFNIKEQPTSKGCSNRIPSSMN